MTFFKTTHFPKIRRRKKSDGNKSVVKEYDEDNCDDDDDNNNDDVITIILTCSGRRQALLGQTVLWSCAPSFKVFSLSFLKVFYC